MLPTIDALSPGVVGATPLRQHETDKAIEAYKAAPAVERKPEVEKREEDRYQPSASRETDVIPASKGGKDQAELNFHLTVEERDAFLAAFSSKQDAESMSAEEKETLQKASERISKFIDEAIARKSDSRERVEKAVGEWYSRMTKGEQGPMDLINLLRQAAMGNLDGMTQ